MIPRAHITAWRSKAPWSTDAQVEQDLVISRVIVELFSDELLEIPRNASGKHRYVEPRPGAEAWPISSRR